MSQLDTHKTVIVAWSFVTFARPLCTSRRRASPIWDCAADPKADVSEWSRPGRIVCHLPNVSARPPRSFEVSFSCSIGAKIPCESGASQRYLLAENRRSALWLQQQQWTEVIAAESRAVDRWWATVGAVMIFYHIQVCYHDESILNFCSRDVTPIFTMIHYRISMLSGFCLSCWKSCKLYVFLVSDVTAAQRCEFGWNRVCPPWQTTRCIMELRNLKRILCVWHGNN